MNSITDVKTCFHCNQKVNKLNSTKKTAQAILMKYLPNFIRWKWILELISIHVSASRVLLRWNSTTFQALKIYLLRKSLTKFRFTKQGFILKHWWNEVGIVMLAASHLATFYHTVWKATETNQIKKNSSMFVNFHF